MNEQSWFKQFISSVDYHKMGERPIVYFCAEYGLNEDLPIYAGGLGILAGDLIREAADQKVPFIAVGLYYHEGYLYHDLYEDGIRIKSPRRIDPSKVNLLPVVDERKKRILVKVPIEDTFITVQSWSLQIGSARVYLLDTDISENKEEDRKISDHLYASNRELRLKQEIILGLGGLRLLEVLGISPSGYHLNEGHSAFLALELIRYEMKNYKLSFKDAVNSAKKHIFFTNHTLVIEGNEVFDTDRVSALLSGFAKEIKVPIDEILKLGAAPNSNIFSMTHLALQMSEKANAVSKLHAKKAAEIWTDHPMIPITNGIHIRTWDRVKGKETLWDDHLRNKRILLESIRKITGVIWDENILLLGWARRIVNYKRPLALFDNIEEFRKLALSSDHPMRVVISGLSHESDSEGLEILEKMQKIVKKELKDLVIYLPDYSMSKAKLLVAGCDVWLNTPIVGFEACGTSGMKAALNGVLPCSTRDGWVAEAELDKVGWPLENESLSENILAVLKDQIAPLYYDKNKNGVSEQWLVMMQNAREMTLNQFSATTMLQKYIEEFYLPAIRAHKTKS